VRSLPGARTLLALAVVLALAGSGALALAATGAPDPSRVTPPPTVSVAPPQAGPIVLAPSPPVALDVPAIGVHTALLTLGLNADGTVEVPPLETDEPGWYDGSPTPGEIGPAVILGHVDSARSGPAVFYDLAALLPGDTIGVTRADGSTVTFHVDEVARYPKRAFPTEAVYGDLDHAGLRLITCGGEFFRRAGYLDNVVVYAHLTGERRA
jgi:Sortase domain